ncbi:preprotein translocase subunit YajC [Buchananella felis]|uniref:preprotein translocase subunit YajC n=1 Tax=Buchananella felis TaxID=3231492 RepID=UPI003526E5E6
MPQQYMIWLLPLFLILAMWWMGRSAKKQQARQEQERDAALVPGKWVVTIGGFYGRVVEVDGLTVTLESPAGDETLWARRAIRGAEEPVFSSLEVTSDEPESTTDKAAE